MHIVVLGAGYGGLRVALDFDHMLRGRTHLGHVTLVDQNPYHQIIQVLHHTATGGDGDREPIVYLDRVLRNRLAVRFRLGRAMRIDPQGRQVLLDDGLTLDYDRLVIALGAVTAYGGVPGAAEHTLPLHTFDDAVRLRNHIRTRFTEAATTRDATERRILLTFAIVGGGYTGCQFAGELAAWVRKLCPEAGVSLDEVRIALVERSDILLHQFGSWATGIARRVLDRAGVNVYLHMAVERVEPRALFVDGGRVLRAGTLVWAAGIRGPQLLADSGLPVEEHGRVLVDTYLRVQDQPRIFAIGDCAVIPNTASGAVHATASQAMRQGQHVAQLLIDELEGRMSRSYEPLRLGEMVSLGPEEAVGDPLGMPITGYPVLLMKKGVEEWYRATLE